LLCGGGAIIGFHNVVRQIGTVFLAADDRQNRTLAAFALVFPLVASAFCLLTAWGIQTGKSWASMTGICASFLLIALFSWLSLAGFWCLWAITRTLKMPVESKAVKPPPTSTLAPHAAVPPGPLTSD
jgi:hypothetical protein